MPTHDALRAFVRRKANGARLMRLEMRLEAIRDGLRAARRAGIHAAGLQLPRHSRAVMRWATPLLQDGLGQQAGALMTARSEGWDAAAPLFRQIAARPDAERLAGAAGMMLRSNPSPPLTDLAIPALARPARLLPEIGRRIVVYTSRSATATHLPPLFGAPEGVRFICFSDRPLPSSHGWEIHLIKDNPDHPRTCRIRPHVALAEAAPAAEYSLYIAPDRRLVGNLHTLFARWLLPQPFAMWRHGTCTDWHDLAERQLVNDPAQPEGALAQVADCEAEQVPRGKGAFDTGMIWRRHADPGVAEAMDAWWALLADGPPGGEDIALYRLLHGDSAPGCLPANLPATLGCATRNIFVAADRQPGRASPTPQAPALSGKRRGITFVLAPGMENAGITLMRCRQLSKLIADRFGDRYDVTLTSDQHQIRDQVVIVNRSAIEASSSAELAALRARNIALVSDFLDMPIRPRHDRLFDAHMAFSLGQAFDLQRLFPATPAFNVTHNVNSDVPHATPPTDRLRTAYFGQFTNTTVPATLAPKVDLVAVIGADFTASHWQEAAPRYNCHWIVREAWRDAKVRWKPFLKGFVAARCKAVVIVTRDDTNAPHYLGDDYPFYAASVDPADLEDAWIGLAAAFGGPDWAFARDIMQQVEARSSDDAVCGEFKAMMDEIIG